MIIEVTGSLVIQEAAREWCKLPYPDHPKGCPAYGRKTCPPKVGLVQDLFDLSRKHWFIIVPFDIAAHAAGMKERHPQWSDRMCRNCLYWQGGVRKELRAQARRVVGEKPGTISTDCPEAMGVNVFRTCHRHGIMMRKNPQHMVHKVALVGYGRGVVADCVGSGQIEMGI